MKKNLFDNSNLQEPIEWGNIPVGGMTDEELHSTNWNYIDAARERNNCPSTQEKYRAEGKRKSQSEEHKALMREVNKKTAQTKEWQQAHNQENSKRFNDPTWKEWKAEDNRKKMSNPNWHPELMKGIEQRDKTPKFQEHLKKLKQNKYKPIHTPYGDFPSKKDAVESMGKAGIVNAIGKLREWLKTKPTEYYYLDK